MPILRWKQTKAVLLIVFFGLFVFAFPAQADVWTTTSQIISAIAQVIISLVSQILVAFIQILLAVTQYNDFINAPAVIKGWVLVRDVSNLAFLVIFIGIAFATILGVEKYEYKRLLPKLLMMAVLINFSRTICGIILDAAQVVMMTFVNGFKDVAAGNLIRGFGLQDMLTLRDSKPGDPGVTPNTVAAASLLAVVMLIIATITVGVIVVMFLIRIIYLWILVLLSPLAFMLSAAPGLSGKFDEWWGKFIKYAFVGPIMAFFLWLSFSIMASVQPGSTLASESRIMPTDTYDERVGATITKIGESDQLLSYGIAIALLLLSLSIASEMGVKGGKLAESALGRIRSGGATLAKVAGVAALTGGLGTVAASYVGYKGRKFIGRRADDLISPTLMKGVGRAGKAIFGDTRLGKGFGALAEKGTKFRVLAAGWKARKEKREKERTAAETGAAQDMFNGVLDNKKTKFVSRQVAALVHAEEKEQHENTSGTTEEYMQILKNGTEIEQKAALLNLAKQNDWNSALLDEDVGDKVREKLLGDMKKGISPDVDKEISAILELSRSITEQEKVVREKEKFSTQAKTDLQAAEQTLETVRQGGDAAEIAKQEQVVATARDKADAAQAEFNAAKQEVDEPEVENKKAEIKNRIGKLDRNGRAYYKYQRYQYVDSDRHKEALVKTMFGENNLSTDFMGELGQVGLKLGAMGTFGLNKFNPETGETEFMQTHTDEGMTRHLDALVNKFRNMKAGDLLNIHPTVFRDEIIDEKGEHRYDEDITEDGRLWLVQAQQYFTERNLGNIRQDTFAALTGVHINKYVKDLSSIDPAVQGRAQRDFYAAMKAGFEKDLLPILSADAAKNFEAALDRYNPDKSPKREEPKKETKEDEDEVA